MSITKIGKYKKNKKNKTKLNSNSMTERKTDMNITKYKKLILTEHKTT